MRVLAAFVGIVPLFAQTILLRPAARDAKPEKVLERGTEDAHDRAVSDVSDPSVTVYLPETSVATGRAVIICPGGGYVRLAIDKEGHDVARWLQGLGYAGIVLKYRLPGSMKDGDAGVAVEDGVAAVRLVRANAAKWGLAANGVGMMGFSAGGHLASTVGMRAPEDARPDFLVLGYPAIPQGVDVTAGFPPTFLVHADDDKLPAVDNSVRMYLALKKAGVKAELHVYATGGHGFGMKKTQATAAAWPEALRAWLKTL